jgi:hypothetical protein
MLDDAARESGFGTGLLAHLERGRPNGFEPVAEPVPAEPAAQPPVRASGPGEGVPGEPEGSPAASEPPDPLAERERMLAEREAALEAARGELARREAQFAAREAPVSAAGLAEHLRARAERAADRVWSAFGEALEATHPDGRPDHAMRIAAAQALLAELRLDPPGAAFADELARRRERREATR